MKTDRSRLIGSKEPSGNFCKAFSYVRFLFFRGSNYSIKTNRPSADRSGPIPDAGCVELMSSRTNGITSLLVTCDLFRKALSLFVMIRGVSISVIRGVREWQSYTTDFTSVRSPSAPATDRSCDVVCVRYDGNVKKILPNIFRSIFLPPNSFRRKEFLPATRHRCSCCPAKRDNEG